MKNLGLCFVLAATAIAAHGAMVLGPWTPIYQGVDHAIGTNTPNAAFPRLQVVNVLRVDLTDPDVRLLAEPPCTNCPAGYETMGRTTSAFLEYFGLQGAMNYSFFTECCSATPDTPMHVFGLLISEGQEVSPDWTPSDIDARNFQSYLSVMMFDTNNAPRFIAYNWPAASHEGVYTAVAGSRPALTNGVIVNRVSDADPRNAIGINQDGRYLYLLTVDGRQPGYSVGANDNELGAWLKLAGAYNAINVDGGGSAAMVRSDACGKAVQLNRPINLGLPGRERVVAGHFGFYAKPLPGMVNDVKVTADKTAAEITWTTLEPGSSQVQYGLSPNYNLITELDPTPATEHRVSLGNLAPNSRYYFRVLTTTANGAYWQEFCFNTAAEEFKPAFDVTQSWRYSTQNLDGIQWQARSYNDSDWPSGPGLLYVENNTLIHPKNTLLPTAPTTYPFITYYFRTHFTFPQDPEGAVLVFSNYLDDGAVYYLNGVEIHRAFLPDAPTVIRNNTLANSYHCNGGDATCPYLFTNYWESLTSLVAGDNVLAVEVHNYDARSPDIVFGAELTYYVPPPKPPPAFIQGVTVIPGETTATIRWTTVSNATTRVEYGLTPALGSATPLNAAMTLDHSVTLSNLATLATYHYRVISSVGTNQYSASGQFATIPYYESLVPLTQAWKWTTNNQNGISWMLPGFNDDGWSGPGRALLFIEDNPDVAPRNTLLPGAGSERTFPTYYFRTHFTVSNDTSGLALQFSNYIDDGAVFYLNGKEIYRLRMPEPPTPITYTTYATDKPAFDEAIDPDNFKISGPLMTNLLRGDNVLAVELHQVSATSPDVVLGSAAGLVRAALSETPLRIERTGDQVTISWNGSGTLQETHQLGVPNSWNDVPGPVKTSPYILIQPSSSATFYRLRE